MAFDLDGNALDWNVSLGVAEYTEESVDHLGLRQFPLWAVPVDVQC